MYLEQVPAIYKALVRAREAQRSRMPSEQALALDIGWHFGVATGPWVVEFIEQRVLAVANQLARP